MNLFNKTDLRCLFCISCAVGEFKFLNNGERLRANLGQLGGLGFGSKRVHIYFLPGGQISGWGLFFGFWANLALYGGLPKNEATGQVGVYGLG